MVFYFSRSIWCKIEELIRRAFDPTTFFNFQKLFTILNMLFAGRINQILYIPIFS